MIEGDLKLFSRALRHYSKRILELKKDECVQNEKLQEDLNENSKRALEIADELDSFKNTEPYHVTCIKCAVVLYKKDLSESMNLLEKKIGINIPTKNTMDEINFIERTIKDRNWNINTICI